jgi:hypothetical protein
LTVRRRPEQRWADDRRGGALAGALATASHRSNSWWARSQGYDRSGPKRQVRSLLWECMLFGSPGCRLHSLAKVNGKESCGWGYTRWRRLVTAVRAAQKARSAHWRGAWAAGPSGESRCFHTRANCGQREDHVAEGIEEGSGHSCHLYGATRQRAKAQSTELLQLGFGVTQLLGGFPRLCPQRGSNLLGRLTSLRPGESAQAPSLV